MTPTRAGSRARAEHAHAGGYGPIIAHLNRLKVHHLTMKFTAPQAGDMAVYRELHEDLEIGLGCVDVTPGRIDSAEFLGRRVRRLTSVATRCRTLSTVLIGSLRGED